MAEKTFSIKASKLRGLIECIPQLEGIAGRITITVSMEDLAQLEPESLQAFADAVESIVQVQQAQKRTGE